MHNDEASQVPQLIGSAEVCTRLEISRSTLQLRIQLGEIQPAGKMPGKSGAYLFDPMYIDRLVEDRRTEAERAERAEQWANLPAYTDPADPRAPGHKAS